jgi:hypothetical protein
VSEVEVSPSTVIALNEPRLASASSAWSRPAGSVASVNRKASMVAMSGWIMPEPLQMPQIVTSRSPIVVRARLPLAKVSVVMIALAASSQALASSLALSSGSRATTVATSRRSPITPVEAM